MRALTLGLLAQRGHLIGWVPVALACGIGAYFNLPAEPRDIFFLFIAIVCASLFIVARYLPVAVGPLVLVVALALGGFTIAKLRSEAVAGPVLTFRFYGAIQGRIIDIDRSASDATRLTLDQVVLERVPPDRTPRRVRVSLHGDAPQFALGSGDVVLTTGHLSPPSGAAEPDGFNFQRHAWFEKLGGVGYTRNPLVRLDVSHTYGFRVLAFDARMRLSAAVQGALAGETGAFAAAIMTGDRSGMSQETLTDLRRANLAHLLAISGLHMGLLTGFVFAALRYGLVLLPRVGLVLPVKKIAALAAICVGAVYLVLSGGNVATERAFIMVAVMFVAVLLDRRALTLRAVAMAATMVLLIQPESLIGPGFQMSFAATTALVAVFAGMRRFDLSHIPKWGRAVLSVVLSSLVAGLATAPFAAAHFNQIAHYGLIANLLSVPLMGILVMPAAVLAVCLAPFGLWQVGLWFMSLGLQWILFVAHSVAGADGALSHVVAPQWFVLPVLSFGGLWLILWQGRARVAGIACVIVGFGSWGVATRPQVLVAESGALIGVMTPDGRSLSKPKGDGFVAGIWLENDGGPVTQDVAAVRGGMERADRMTRVFLGDWQILQVSGKTALSTINGCDGADVLISNQSLPPDTRPCLVLDQRRLRESGAVALDLADDGTLRLRSAARNAGARPWSAGQVTDLPGSLSKTNAPPSGDASDVSRSQYVRINPTSRP